MFTVVGFWGGIGFLCIKKNAAEKPRPRTTATMEMIKSFWFTFMGG